MIKSIIIANTFGAVNFSHYFEPIPIQFRVSYEKENVDRVLPLVFIGEKEVRSDCLSSVKNVHICFNLFRSSYTQRRAILFPCEKRQC